VKTAIKPTFYEIMKTNFCSIFTVSKEFRLLFTSKVFYFLSNKFYLEMVNLLVEQYKYKCIFSYAVNIIDFFQN